MGKTNKVAPTPGPGEPSQPQKNEPTKKKLKVSKDFLLNQGLPQDKKDARAKRTSNVAPADMPEAMRQVLKDALTHSDHQAKDIDIPINKKGRSARPAKTKQELDKEIAQLLWKINVIGRIQDRWADLEFKAFHAHLNIADLCTQFAVALLPILALAILWDVFATVFLEIPYLTTIRHAGVTVPFHFLAIPATMYGFMMQSLHQQKSKFIKWSIVCVVLHPLIFIFRFIIEYKFDHLRNEKSIRYESYTSAAFDKPDDFEGAQEIEFREVPTWQLGNI